MKIYNVNYNKGVKDKYNDFNAQKYFATKREALQFCRMNNGKIFQQEITCVKMKLVELMNDKYD